MVRERVPELTDPTVRLAAMDAQGVDVQLVSPSPSPYHYWVGEDTAGKLYRLANEATAAPCSAASDRLRGLGLVPLRHPRQAVRALDHALDQELLGVEISSRAPGRELSDPACEPFWSRAEETGAIVFLHPFGCTLDAWTSGTSPTPSASRRRPPSPSPTRSSPASWTGTRT